MFRRKAGDAGRMAPVEVLGEVRSASGDLVVLDFGLLRMWSAERPPVLEEGLAPPHIVEIASAAGDYEIVGPDADAVAALVDLAAVKGRFGFDLPEEGAAHLGERVAAICDRERLRADVLRIDRVPHLDRLRRLLADSPGGAEVPFHGLWGVAVRGLPTGRSLPVLGQRMDPAGPDGGRWRSVWVQCAEAEAVDTVEAGYVLVDEARLLLADPQVLGEWRNDESADGLADVVFWGRDEVLAAERSGAKSVDDGGDKPIFGWLDRPLAEALQLIERVEGLQAGGMKLVVDVRPHDDHHRMLSRARRAATGAGVIELAGQPVTGFFTSWGDGAFPVHRDVTADGTLVRLRVELGAPEIVSRTRRFEELWFGELSKQALVSTRVTREGAPIGWLYRETPDRESDSGWRILAGDESDEFANDPDNIVLLPLRDLIQGHPEIEPLLSTPPPVAFSRDASGTLQREDR